MIKPNRKNKKKYEFHPIETSKNQISSGLSEEEQVEESLTILNKLNSSSSKTREQITSLLANATIFPQEMADKAVLKQLLIRVVDDSIPIAYNAVFAINNLIRNDASFLQPLYQLNVFEAIISLLKRVTAIQQLKTARRVLEGVYLLIETILATLSLQQLRVLQGTENMRFIVSFTLEALAGSPFLHDSEIIFQVLAYLSEYSQLRTLIGEDKHLETILSTVSAGAPRALLCTILAFSKNDLSEKTISEIADFVNETLDDINLQSEYKQNVIKPQMEEEEVDMQAQVEGNDDEFEDMDEEKVLEVQGDQKDEPIKNQVFLESIELLEITSNLVLSLVEEMDEEVEDEQSAGQQQVAINVETRNKLKLRIKCTRGILRNAGLSFPESEVLVEQSWNIIRNAMPAFSHDDLLQLSLSTLSNLLERKLPFNHELLLSVTENCLEIIYKIWKQNSQLIKLPVPILLSLTNFDVLEKASNKIVVLIFDLISLKYNPEEQPVSESQNLVIGTNLKEFIVKSQNLELQCQCLDTVFSVYSNEDFDKTFKNLGYMELLYQGMEALNSYKHKIKFTRVVHQDLARFIEYKKQKLMEQKLL